MADDLYLFIDGQDFYCCWVLFLDKGPTFGSSPAAEPRQGSTAAPFTLRKAQLLLRMAWKACTHCPQGNSPVREHAGRSMP